MTVARWTQKQMKQEASEIRRGLGLRDDQPIDPYALAEDWGLPVYNLTTLSADSPAAASHFSTHGSKQWSAALVPCGRQRLIVENDSHQVERRRSSICHEMGHHIMEHPFDLSLSTEKGCDGMKKVLEDSASFMAGQLLIPEAAARRAAFDDWTNQQVAAQWHVSAQMAQKCMYGMRVLVENVRRKQARIR